MPHRSALAAALVVLASTLASQQPAAAGRDWAPEVRPGSHFSERYRVVLNPSLAPRPKLLGLTRSDTYAYTVWRGRQKVARFTRSAGGNYGSLRLAPGRYRVVRQRTATFKERASAYNVYGRGPSGFRCTPHVEEAHANGDGWRWSVTATLACRLGHVEYSRTEHFRRQLRPEIRQWNFRDTGRMHSTGASRYRWHRESARFTVTPRNSPRATGREYRAVRVGMTPRQVAAIIGGPGFRFAAGNRWQIRKYSDWSVTVVFVDGRVQSKHR